MAATAARGVSSLPILPPPAADTSIPISRHKHLRASSKVGGWLSNDAVTAGTAAAGRLQGGWSIYIMRDHQQQQHGLVLTQSHIVALFSYFCNVFTFCQSTPNLRSQCHRARGWGRGRLEKGKERTAKEGEGRRDRTHSSPRVSDWPGGVTCLYYDKTLH